MIDGIHVRSIEGKNLNDGKIICTKGDIVEEYPPSYSIYKAVKEFKKKHNIKTPNKKETK
jgi:hypothetical protein